MNLINEETWYLKFKGFREDLVPFERIDACFTIAKIQSNYMRNHLKEMCGIILSSLRHRKIKFTTDNFIEMINEFGKPRKNIKYATLNYYSILFIIYLSNECNNFSHEFQNEIALAKKEIYNYAYRKSI